MGLAAICRRSHEAGDALATTLGCRYHASPDDLLADPDVDGVVIATPPSSHFELARAVLAARKPLLLEKPMTGSVAEARDLVWLDERSGTSPLMVGQALRWNPVLKKVRDLWPQLGNIQMVRAAQRLGPTELGWQRCLDETVGGSVLLTGVHLFDTVRWLTGAEFVQVDSRQRQVINPVVEDQFLASAVLSDGCWASCEVTKTTDSRAGWFEAVGEKGQLLADYQGDRGIILRIGSTQKHLDISAKAPTLPALLADWLEAIGSGGNPPVTVHDGLATLEVVDACYRSAVENGPCPV